MLQGLSWRQFLEWREFDRVEPFGGQRGDWRAASIVSTLLNVSAAWSGSKKRYTLKDGLLNFGRDDGDQRASTTGRQSWQEQKAIAMMFAALANAPQKKPKRR